MTEYRDLPYCDERTEMTDFATYQRRATETAIYPGQGELAGLMYAALGAGNEAGEVQGKIKKIFRDMEDVDLAAGYPVHLVESVRDEVGDVCWYLAQIANEMGFSLGESAALNLVKLERRKLQGTLKGSGDNR